MAKKREPDNLAKDTAAALAAKMSYGKWKAFHPHTRDGGICVPVIKTKPCEFCGKLMRVGGRGFKRYCSEECAYNARCVRKREYKQRVKE